MNCMHLGYSKDVMDRMTAFRNAWGIKCPFLATSRDPVIVRFRSRARKFLEETLIFQGFFFCYHFFFGGLSHNGCGVDGKYQLYSLEE